MMKRLALIVLLTAIVGIGYFTVTKLGGPAVAGTLKTMDQSTKAAGQPTVSDLTFTDIDGKSVKVDPNKKTILHFIVASGCTSCAESEAKLTKFQNNPDLGLISIDIDPRNDDKETIQEFMNITKAQWPHVIDTDQSLIRKFNVTSIDTVVIVYQNKIIFSGVNPSLSQVEKVLK